MTRSPDGDLAPVSSALVDIDGYERQVLSTGWQAARSHADQHARAADIDALGWIAAEVPGTAAAALRDAGLWRVGDAYDFDAEDWWFRTRFETQPALPGEQVRLHLDGIATVAEVYLNGELILESDSMFAAHAVDIAGRVRARNELTICCRALAPLLAQPRRPRARWRTRLVAEGNLRFFRTMLLGRLPGIAPGPAAVGPCREVRLERRRHLEVAALTLHTRLDGEDGVVSASARVRSLDGIEVSEVALELRGASGSYREALALQAPNGPDGEYLAHGELRVPGAARWWPHTHGEPVLHDVRLVLTGGQEPTVVSAGRVGFRELEFGTAPDHDVERDGLELHVNGVRVFARGAVWTPIDPIGLAPDERELQAELLRVRDAGMNMLRLAGTSTYETARFHDLCDELGILVWQDFMFANLDYPIADERFRASVTREATDVLRDLGGRPSVVVLCGNSEVEQQAAMMGLDPALARGELFGELLPQLVRESATDAVYVPSAPCGGDLPFRPSNGVGTYYAVGSYRRPLEDVRRANVRFASECLAFSNVPAQRTIEAMLPEAPGRLAGNHPLWKAGVPRDNEADWDFEDVRDHYLRVLFEVDAAQLRHVDRPRYLELSRVLTGEIMAEVFGEWRRARSPCGGGLVLWMRDLLPGAGWGLVDHNGEVKLVYHHLKRALAPIAVWTIDENLGGVVVHVANDGPTPLRATLRVSLYRDGEHRVEQANAAVELAAHGHGEWNVEAVIGRFVDAAWAYRFGPPAQDAIVVSLEQEHGERSHLLSQAVRFPARRPLRRETAESLGLAAEGRMLADGAVELTVRSRRLVYGVEIQAPGFSASDNGFSVEPGGERLVILQPSDADSSLQAARLGAVNMNSRVRIALG
jgi:beta-mannosidase